MAEPARNLVLVHSERLQDVSDYEAIRERMAERAPDVEVFIARNARANPVTRRWAVGRPTLVFSPIAITGFRPERGRIVAGRAMPKIEEMRRLAAAGVRVPRFRLVEPETRLDEADWGPFTVLKPDVGRQGLGVTLSRTRDVRWVDPRSWPAGDPRRGRRMVAQVFVDTGTYPSIYRVMTVFGRAVYSTVSRSKRARPDLDPAGAEPIDMSIAATVERDLRMSYDMEVIRAAEAIYPAMPDIPVHGVDIIREAATGLLYVLEINPSGLTWHISSDLGRYRMRTYALDFPGQFGALDIIADALIEATRRLAE